MSDAHAFLEPLWGEGYHSVCYQRRPSPFNVLGFAESIEECVRDSMRLSQQRCDTWYSVHALPVKPTHGRGRSEDVVTVLALPVDLDWADEAHKGTELLPEGALIERLAEFSPEPSIVVRSGHGLQCYWLLTCPVPAAEGLALTELLHMALAEAGLKPERFDLASVLRLPGTTNYKREPVMVTLSRLDPSIRHDPVELALSFARFATPPPMPFLSSGIELPDLAPSQGDYEMTPIEWFLDHHDPERVAFAHGWQFHSANTFNGVPTMFVTCPGKDVREGHSGRLFPGEGLLVWSSVAQPLIAGRYYDAAELAIAYDYGGDKARFASEVRRTQMPRASQSNVLAFRAPEAAPEAPREPTRWPRLPETFWQSSPVLGHLAAVADAYLVSREAVAMSVMPLALLHVPNVVALGQGAARAGLNLFACLVGPPGSGKGSAMNAAEFVLAPPSNTVHTTLGTAEGLIKAFHHRDPEHEGKGTPALVRRYNPVLIRTDEVGNFAAMAGGKDNRGESLLAELKQAWMGERLGKGYAADDKGLLVTPHTYRIGGLLAIAPVKAEPLFGDAGGGFPERLLFAPAPVAFLPPAGHRPPDPGPLRWRSPWEGWRQDAGVGFQVAAAVMVAVEEANAPHRMGQSDDPLDVHATLSRLKLGAALATLDGRRSVEWFDWERAGALMELSRATRTLLLSLIAGTHTLDEVRAGQRAGRIEQARLTVRSEHESQLHSKRVIEVAERVARFVGEHRQATRKQARNNLSARQREVFEDALLWLLEAEVVVEVKEQLPTGVRKVLRQGPRPMPKG